MLVGKGFFVKRKGCLIKHPFLLKYFNYPSIIYCIIFILHSSKLVHSQTLTLFNYIHDESKPLSFVNIGILSVNKGTISNEDGFFELEVLLTDTIKISSIGHCSMTIPVCKINSYDTIFLKSKIYEINEIKITESRVKRKNEIIGYLDLKKKGQILELDGGQIAVLIKNESNLKSGFIESIRFQIIKEDNCNYDLIIRLLDLNENLEPGDDLISEYIIINSKNIKNNSKIDISKYKIKMPSDGLFVVFQWLNHDCANQKDMNLQASFYHEIVVWLNYWDKEWRKSKSPYNKKFNGYIVPKVSVEVSY